MSKTPFDKIQKIKPMGSKGLRQRGFLRKFAWACGYAFGEEYRTLVLTKEIPEDDEWVYLSMRISALERCLQKLVFKALIDHESFVDELKVERIFQDGFEMAMRTKAFKFSKFTRKKAQTGPNSDELH